MKKAAFLATVVIALGSSSALAEKVSAVYSPKCDQAKVQKLVGSAGKVDKGAYEGGFNVTLDESKLTFTDLTKKLQAESCF